MIPFVEWMQLGKFVVRESWDFKKGRMVGIGPLVLMDFQKRILSLALTPDKDGILPFSTIVYSTIKKSGKTAIASAVVAWAADQLPDGSEIYVIANDLEQAEGRVMRDVKFHYREIGIPAHKYAIELPNGTTIQAVAKEYRSAAGSRHSLTVWDELWGYISENSRRMWSELTPIPTVKNSFRLVTTYAGYENESELLWDMYLSGVGPEEHREGRGDPIKGLEDLPVYVNGRQFTYWDHEARMPWQTDAYYEDQIRQLRAGDYIRLHQNMWVTSHETFIPIEWWDAACDAGFSPDAETPPQSAELWDKHPYRYHPVSIGIDVAPKHDCSAVVGSTYDSEIGKVVQLFHKIWTPRSDEVFDLEGTVEAYLDWANSRFHVTSMVYDPHEFHRSMTTLLRKGYPMKEFTQTVENMTAASQQLFDVLKNKSLISYPDEELRSHIQNCVAENHGRGFRIVKGKERKGAHIDGATALAMSVYEAVENGAAVSQEAQMIESPFGDVSAVFPEDAQQRKMAFPFRELDDGNS